MKKLFAAVLVVAWMLGCGHAALEVGSTQEQFAAFLKADTARWAKVIKDGNIKVD